MSSKPSKKALKVKTSEPEKPPADVETEPAEEEEETGAPGVKEEEVPKLALAPPKVSPPAAPKAPAPKVKELEVVTFTLAKISTKEALQLVNGDAVAVKAPATPMTEEEVMSLLPAELGIMGAKGRGLILGVNTTMVLKNFLEHLVAARLARNPAPIIYCGVLAVAIAYSVSREWVAEYGAIPSPHMFTPFEIEGRTKVKAVDDKKAVEWVAGSNMNASALRIFGSMIVEAGKDGPFLKHVKATAGTIFNPPAGATERDELMKEANKAIGDADKAALAIFTSGFVKYARLVGAVFGGGQVDFVSYLEAANAVGEVVI